MVMMITFLALFAAPAIAYARSSRNAVLCLMNLRELNAFSDRYAADRGGLLIAAGETTAALARAARPGSNERMNSNSDRRFLGEVCCFLT